MYSNQRTCSIVYYAPIRELKLKMGMPIPFTGRRIRLLPEAVTAPFRCLQSFLSGLGICNYLINRPKSRFCKFGTDTSSYTDRKNDCFRKSRGLIPISARKARLRLEASLKPLSTAISKAFTSPSDSRTAASASLNRRTYWCGVRPLTCSNVRRKW